MAIASTLVCVLLAVTASAAAAAIDVDLPVIKTTTTDGALTLPFRPDYPYNSTARKFYKLHRNPASWENARDTCRLEGTVLAYPETQREREALHAIQRTKEDRTADLWIGLYARWSALSKHSSGAIYGQPESLQIALYLAANGSQISSNYSAEFPFVCEISEATACNASVPGYALGPDARSCYKMHTTKQYWPQALLTCVREKSHLAIINSQEEADHLVKVVAAGPFKGNGVGVGYHDLIVEGSFLTVDGLPLASSGYEKWASGEPNNEGGKENCGVMLPDGRLNDIPCDLEIPFVCEKEAAAPRAASRDCYIEESNLDVIV